HQGRRFGGSGDEHIRMSRLSSRTSTELIFMALISTELISTGPILLRPICRERTCEKQTCEKQTCVMPISGAPIWAMLISRRHASAGQTRSDEHTSELQSQPKHVCRL